MSLTSQKWRDSSRRKKWHNSEKDHITEKSKQIEHSEDDIMEVLKTGLCIKEKYLGKAG